MVDIMSRKPDGNTKIITNFFCMLHAKFDRFEIRVLIMSYLITVYQCETCIVENKLDISRLKLMSVNQRYNCFRDILAGA